MSRKALHLQVSDAENIHPRLKMEGEKIDKEDVKNCLQPDTVSALCIIAGEGHRATKNMFTFQA
jgi:hypothetical protein